MNSTKFNRRRFLGASAALTVAPYVRTSRAAGSLAVGFWDHWVPGANEALAKLCNEWAAKEKVDLKVDFIAQEFNHVDELLRLRYLPCMTPKRPASHRDRNDDFRVILRLRIRMMRLSDA